MRGFGHHLTSSILRLIKLCPFLLLSLPGQAAPWKSKFLNILQLQPSYYFENIGKGTTQVSIVIRDEPEWTVKTPGAVKFRIHPWLYADPVASSASERAIFDFNEANLEWRPKDLVKEQRFDIGLQVGLNRVSWGVTDFYNPLDVVSARRYIDPLNAEKRAVPSVDLSWESETWRVEGVYIPWQQESIMPGERSRWLPREVFLQRQFNEFTLLLAPDFQYSYMGTKVFDHALQNNYGLRLERRGSGLDLTGVFFQGAPPAPAIATPQVEARTDPQDASRILAYHIVLQPTYYVRRTVGLGAVITLDTIIIRMAVADSARVSTLSSLPGWSRSAVIGVEKNFAVAASNLTLLLQSTHVDSEDQAGNSVASLDRIFDRSWLLGLRLATSGALTYNCAALFDRAASGWYGLLKAEYKVTDGMSASLQGDWFDGAAGTPLGTYRGNRRVTLGTTFFF
jgi:hypothetical protein